MGKRHAKLRASIPAEHGFGHYLLDRMEEQEMTIRGLCRLASSPEHLRFNENTFYKLVHGRARSVTDLDLIFLSTILHTSSTKMIAMYMADKARFDDLDQTDLARVARQDSFLNILAILPPAEVEELEMLAQAKVERYREKMDAKRARLHGKHDVNVARK